MPSPIDGGLLRAAALTAWDVAVIRKLGQQGGESQYNPATYPAERRALILRLVDRKLIEIVKRDGRDFVKLTDFGRNALTQIEAADKNAKERRIHA